MVPPPPSSSPFDPREVRRDAIRLTNAAGRSRDRTAGQVAALGHSVYDQALGAGRGSQTLLPSGQIYTGALAPGSSMRGPIQSNPGSGLYLATAPSLSSTGAYNSGAYSQGSSATGLGTLRAPDNMRAQKQAVKEKKAKIKKKKAVQAQVAASALAGRSETSLLHPGSAAPGTGPSSGRASPAPRSSGDDDSVSRPRPTRRISSSSNANNTVTVVASASSTSGQQIAPSSRPVTPSSVPQAAAGPFSAQAQPVPTQSAAPATTESATRQRRRRTQNRPSAAASELASQTESRPYNLYQEMLGASSEEERALEEPSSQRRRAPPPHTTDAAPQDAPSAPTQAPATAPATSNEGAEPPVQVENTDPDLAAALQSTFASQPIDIPSYPPPPFPSGPYSTRPRTPPTPPPPLRPPDPTMTEQQQQEERELERAWESYRAKWAVPSSPPPAFRSDDEDGNRAVARRAQGSSPAGEASSSLADARRGSQSSQAATAAASDSEAESAADSDGGSVSSARRAWEDDLRSGLSLEERVARELHRRAAKVAAHPSKAPEAEAEAEEVTSAAVDQTVEPVPATPGSDSTGEFAEASEQVLDSTSALVEAEAATVTPLVTLSGAARTALVQDSAGEPLPPPVTTHRAEAEDADAVAPASVPLEPTTATAEVSTVDAPSDAPVEVEPESRTLQGAFSVDAGAFLQNRLQSASHTQQTQADAATTSANQDPPPRASTASDIAAEAALRRLPTINAKRLAALEAQRNRIGSPLATAASSAEPSVRVTSATPSKKEHTADAAALRRLPTVNAKRLAALEQRTRSVPGAAAVSARPQPAAAQGSGPVKSSPAARPLAVAASNAAPTRKSQPASPLRAAAAQPSDGTLQAHSTSSKYHRDALAAAERRRQLWQSTQAGNPSPASSTDHVVPDTSSILVLPKAPRTSVSSHFRKLSGEEGTGSGSSGAYTGPGDLVDLDDDGIASRPLSRASRPDSFTSHDDEGKSSAKDGDAGSESDSSEEQWQAEQEAFERIQAKEEAILRMRQRAEEDESSDEEPVVRASEQSSTQQQLQALAHLDKMVPRAPPPLALGRSRSGAAFSSSSEESSEDERRLESTGSEPEAEDFEEERARRSSDVSVNSLRSVDTSALAAFNYLRARTMQLTGLHPDASMESAPGEPEASAQVSQPAQRRRLPSLPPTLSQSPTKAHFVQNEADDDAIAAHVFSQFSSAQKGKAPVRPIDHLLFSPSSAASALPAVTPAAQDPVAMAPSPRPLPIPPSQAPGAGYMPIRPAVENRGISIQEPSMPPLPPRPSDLPDSLYERQPSVSLADRQTVGSRLKGLFGAQLEGSGSGAELLQGETAEKIRGLFDQPLTGRDLDEPRSARTSSKPAEDALSLHRNSFIPGNAALSLLPASPSILADRRISNPPPSALTLENAKDKEVQMQAISAARSDSLRALEARLARASRTLDAEREAVAALPPSSPSTRSPLTSQRPFSEDLPLQMGGGLARSGAITGRNGPPPPAFFTRRFGPRPASFVNPRSGDAPRPLGRLPTITPATRHYEPTKRVVPSSTAPSEATDESASAVGSASPAPTSAPVRPVSFAAGQPSAPPSAGTPSWLAHIPRNERASLPPPIAPIMLHDGDPAPVGPAAQPAPVFARERQGSRYVDGVDDERLMMLQRRPPPPPPSTGSRLPGLATGRLPLPPLNAAAQETGGAITASRPTRTGVEAQRPEVTRSGSRPLPAIPTRAAPTSSAPVTAAPGVEASAGQEHTALPDPQPGLEGEALLQRARSALRPPRREPSLGITDLDLLVSQLESNGDHYEDLAAISEFLGPARSNKPSAAELAALSVGHVELERRRVNSEGRVKQKLSVAGMRVDRCGICLTQFREGEECCIYPCWHIYHRTCSAKVLLNSRVCPTCRKDIATNS
ncbi:hypothetical protein OC842_005178 [Tilletia horrida]|uniref:RING-type domain-containing protein n=1 Tax=Tilletia horrida TaxID=155126 RepID=A0AAN6JPL4_9BASI|nr:hypothetical protein OC842_005178 [Tilletia horrida]